MERAFVKRNGGLDAEIVVGEGSTNRARIARQAASALPQGLTALLIFYVEVGIRQLSSMNCGTERTSARMVGESLRVSRASTIDF